LPRAELSLLKKRDDISVSKNYFLMVGAGRNTFKRVTHKISGRLVGYAKQTQHWILHYDGTTARNITDIMLPIAT